ncbi:hypothetical protein [Nodosilinea nodulosa]|uniref:hypothetical protein n=1 Tax=Nodosilinea nodulosa TaxID=416001 RepID=UPI0002FBDB2D|nr:hypothetical protein [Nodosilinea nodulosa]
MLPLPPEDLPPDALSDADAVLRRQLELSTSRYFFEACEGSLQSLLMECRWSISLANVPMLVIYCPDALRNWRVLSRLTAIAHFLARFSPQAKIRVYSPSSTGAPLDVRVNEQGVL